MKHLKLYEEFDFNDDDFDFEEKDTLTKDELLKRIIFFNTNEEAIDIVNKLKGLGFRILGESDILNDENSTNYDGEKWNCFLPSWTHTSWTRGFGKNHNSNIKYDEFMNMDIIK